MIYTIEANYIFITFQFPLPFQLNDYKLARKNAVPCYLSVDVSIGRSFGTNLWAYQLLAWMPDIHHTRKLAYSVEIYSGTYSFYNGLVLNVLKNYLMALIYPRNFNDYV